MGNLVKFPLGLRTCLEIDNATWYMVWTPLKKAIEKGVPVDVQHNNCGYEYDPITGEILVHGLLDSDGEIILNKDNFHQNMAKYLRGATKC